jgi:lipoate-protein ligase A
MRFLFSTSNNPYFNLATEEYFLKNSKEEMFFLYINEPCIVVGKHQNIFSEINLPFVLENNIKLVRRISGGGTVYQDLNNLNFSYLHNCPNIEKINYKKFTYPILESLRDMGLNVEFSDRNDLIIDTKKISGNAMHIFKTRVLSHGTLLFNTDLNQLSAALKNNPQKYFDKSIKSVRSKVTNISDYLSHPISINEFSLLLFQKIFGKSANAVLEPITDPENESINQILKQKFETWDWIFGYSPKYIFKNSFPLSNQIIEFHMLVEKGIIRNIDSNIDQIENAVYHHAFDILINAKHDYRQITELLTNDSVIKNHSEFNVSEFCENLF